MVVCLDDRLLLQASCCSYIGILETSGSVLLVRVSIFNFMVGLHVNFTEKRDCYRFVHSDKGFLYLHYKPDKQISPKKV